MSKSKTLTSVILWSVISAAFIGPGTVTTAATAGSGYQLDLLWAVSFATFGCILLQELSARLTIVTGLTMGQALSKKYGERNGSWIKFALGGPVLMGCAAYEAGNILGAVSGLTLLIPVSGKVLTIGITLLAAIILWSGKRTTIGWLMTALVAMMGVVFFILASERPFEFSEYFSAALIPSVPEGAALLTLGLVGTTIVPYNVFLGSGISKGQTVPLMRVGLTISVLIGGLITAAILIAGTAVPSFTNFKELAVALSESFGPIGSLSLGLGLFAAGFSSAITSPYAASIIASSVFEWSDRGQKVTWMLVLLIGFAFGISEVKPIPVILTVQALNGLVLPLLTAYLILLINDASVVPKEQRPSVVYNLILIWMFASVLMMGLNNIDKSVSSWMGIVSGHWMVMGIVAALLVGYLCTKLAARSITPLPR